MKNNAKLIFREPFESDYERVAEIYNAVDPHMPVTADLLIERDKKYESEMEFHRWSVILEETIIGTCYYSLNTYNQQSDSYLAMVWLDPLVDKTIFEYPIWTFLMKKLYRQTPKIIQSWVLERNKYFRKKLINDGFSEKYKSKISSLLVKNFDNSLFGGHVEKLKKQGIEILSLNEISHIPSKIKKVYELECDIMEDIPNIGDYDFLTFEDYEKSFLEMENNSPDGNFIAVYNHEPVGLAFIQMEPGGKELTQNITGVKKAYRRLGIATALKLKAIKFAQAKGIENLRTLNDVSNIPMQNINRKLGYIQSPTWILYEIKVSQ